MPSQLPKRLLKRRVDDIPEHTDKRLEDYYSAGPTIGSGHFAVVREAVDVRTGEVVAIKTVRKPRLRRGARSAALDYARAEAQLHIGLAHPHIVAARAAYESDTAHHLVLDRVSGGDLHDLLIDSGAHSEALARHVATQLLSALCYLHDRGIVHRDVKPENVLLEPDLTARLCDFGLSRQVCVTRQSAKCGGATDGDDDGFDDFCLDSALGTPAYCAPEIVRRVPYGRPVDLFALGALTAFVLSGEPAFAGATPEAVLCATAAGRAELRGAGWERASRGARDFVHALLQPDATRRLTARQALCHPWIVGDGDGDVGGPLVKRAVARSLARDARLSMLSLSSGEADGLQSAATERGAASDREPVEELFAWL